MKNLTKVMLAILALVFAIQFAQAQNYKTPKIDASGKITDPNGKYLGTLTKEGVILDASGVTIAHVDATGSLIDEKTGKKLGKAEKNGNFTSAFSKTPDEGLMVSAPMNGTCLIKDKQGNVKGEVHENYKAFGACALHCMSHDMNHKDIMESAAYSCPMHPDVTSDKPGKCSKCGMDLVRKNK